LPIQLSPADRKLLMIAGGGLLLLIATAFLLTKETNSATEVPSTYSTGSGGAKAAYLLLKASGFAVERWEQSLSELPEPAGKILVLAEPTGAPTSLEREKLREFVEKGGRVIATGVFVGLFLPENAAVPDPVPGMTWAKVPAQSPSSITRAAPEITLAPQAYWGSGPFAVPLYGDGDKPLVVKYTFGKGEVIWWASATPLTNAGLKEPGNLEFLLACIGREPGTQILWDEYFHGYRHSLAASMERSPVKWILAQFVLFSLAILITYSRRSGPISIPAKEVRLSPLEFVRTLGSLYQQANAASVAVDISYHRFRYWVTRRLGMPSNASVDELGRAIRERWAFQDESLDTTLRACESAPYDTTLKPHAALQLVRSLHDYAAKLKVYSKSGKERD
jgi:hypothetical protein